jgi:opacity protein-like surface antigen
MNLKILVMSVRKFIFFSFILILMSASSFAQKWKMKRYEASMGIGTSHFYGDIGGTEDANNAAGFKDIQFQYTRPSLSFGARYKIAGDMAVKMNLVYGFVAGNDQDSRNDGRNYSFTSTIFEPSFQFEYYLIPENKALSSGALFNRRGMLNNYSKIYVYLFGGIGGVISNPKLKDGEGNNITKDNFSKFGIAFPFGAGLKFTIDSKWSLGFELGRRFTTTDYIDGYTSKHSEHKDIYDFGMFSVIYNIKSDRRGLPIIGRARKFRF